MTIDPLDLIDEVERAHLRLLISAKGLDDAAVAAPSALPGWTRGHVLTHLARNADSLWNLLTWARTGIETPQYASPQARDTDIEAGAGRGHAEQLQDLTTASDRLVAGAREMPAEAWPVQVVWRNGMLAPAAQVVWARLKETEIHHVDLDAGYRPSDWSEAFTLRMLRTSVPDFAERDDCPRMLLRCTDVDHDFPVGDVDSPVVSGPASSVLAWLIGRSDGADLTVEPAGALPRVPPLG